MNTAFGRKSDAKSATSKAARWGAAFANADVAFLNPRIPSEDLVAATTVAGSEKAPPLARAETVRRPVKILAIIPATVFALLAAGPLFWLPVYLQRQQARSSGQHTDSMHS